MTPTKYRGPGEHSVRELESMLAEVQERIHNFNSTQAEELNDAAIVATEKSLEGGNAISNAILSPLLRNMFKLGAYFIINKKY
jgi:hypothetical protein